MLSIPKVHNFFKLNKNNQAKKTTPETNLHEAQVAIYNGNHKNLYQ